MVPDKETVIKASGDLIGQDDLSQFFLTMPKIEMDRCQFCKTVKNKFVLYCPEAKADLISYKNICLDCFKLVLLE